MTSRFVVVAASSVAFGASLSSAQTSIERLAPENSVLILGSRNTAAMMEHFKSTGLWSLWQHDKIKAMRADAMKEMAEGLDTMFKELGVEEGSLVPPSGPIGLAMFSSINAEMGTPELAFVALADYGDAENADKTAALIDAALERGEKDGDIQLDEKDVNGRTVRVIDLSKAGEDAEDGGDEFDDMGGMPMGDPEQMFEGLKKMNLVREGNAFIMSSSLEALTSALQGLDAGDRAAEGLAGRQDFKSVMGKIGEGDFYGVLLTRDVMDILGAADPMGMTQMLKPMTRALVGKVDGYGFSMRFDVATAMMEQKYVILMPDGKAGLTSLFDAPVGDAMVPAFVPADAHTYSAVSFEFAGLMGVIKQVVNSNPMLQAQAGQVMPQIEMMFKPIFETLGQRMHVASSAAKPLGASSQQTLMAVECAKPQDFENAFAQLAGQMGMEPRDFLGQRIYSLDPAMMAGMMPEMGGEPMEPVSIGVGGGFVLFGPTPAVEQGLRATSQPGAAGFASNADFQRAVAALPKADSVAWGYSDTIDSLEATIAAERASTQQMIDEIAQDDPEFAARFKEQQEVEMKMFEQLDFKLLREHIGPSVWYLRATADGYEGAAYLLPADSK